MKKFHVHFVCTGNAYRSRLAEAYLKSKQPGHITASSSGIKATENYNGAITWYAARLAFNQGLIDFLKHKWTQTSESHFKRADLVVFMNQEHCDFSKKVLGFSGSNYEIWEIPDLSHLGFNLELSSAEDDLRRIKATEQTFADIRKRVDDLITRL